MKSRTAQGLNVAISKPILKNLTFFLVTAFCVASLSGTAFAQTLYDSFSDGEFVNNPPWTGTTSSWTVVTSSDAAAGATNSNTLRLNAPAVSGTEYLSSQISSWGTSQEWNFWLGRRNQAFTAQNQQYFWLYANEAILNSMTVDGYRIAIGDNSGGDEIRLEYIVNGVASAVVLTSTGAIVSDLTDIGFLVRVTRSNTGTWQIFTSTLPTANSTGAVATDVPTSANTPVNQGTGTNNSLIPANNGFIGVAALHTTSGGAPTAAEFDQIYFTPSSPSAATVTVRGRVLSSENRGVSGALVYLTDQNGTTRTARTNAFGYYRFHDVGAGAIYVFNVWSKRYTFQPQVVTLNEEIENLDFTAEQ